MSVEYALGLTATPIRRDGQQPIIFIQCVPIRYAAAKPVGAPQDLSVALHACIDLPLEAGIQDVFRHLANDQSRTAAIATKIEHAFSQGRKVLVLTERTDHLDAISATLNGKIPGLFVLHGRMSRKQQAALIEQLDALPPEAPRVLLATGKLVGEGFDHPPLDTLVLAMPVSWKGTLQQYAGCTASMPARLTCGSSISWTRATRRCCECGISAGADTRPWGIESTNDSLLIASPNARCYQNVGPLKPAAVFFKGWLYLIE